MELSDKSSTVVVRNLRKTYKVTNGSQKQKIDALQGVSLVAKEGESIGVLGRNGSGKSTLLRLISGGEAATSGEVRVTSRPTLLGVSAALQPNLTGIQNVRLGLLAMGVPPGELEAMTAEILQFADIGEAVHRPMSTYSSGMGARLKFAISTSVKPEILLVDEALSTGDASFAKKASERMLNLLSGSGTVFVVSHGAEVIQKNCSRAIWLHQGRIIADGSAENVTKSYRVWGNRKATGKDIEADEIIRKIESYYTPPAIVLESELTKKKGRPTLRKN